MAGEQVVRNGAIPPGGGVKVITRIRRREDLSVADAQAYWRTRHPEVVEQMPGLARHVQDHGRSGPEDRPLIGCATVWFWSWDVVRANVGTPELAAVRADEPNFLDADLPFVVVDANHII